MASTLTTELSSALPKISSSSPAVHRPQRGGLFVRLLVRLIDARQRQANRELARLGIMHGSLR